METTATPSPTTAIPPPAGETRVNGSTPGRSVAGLFSDLWRETTTLVHEEAELAKADISEKVAQAGRAASAIAVGGAIAFAGLLVLLLAAANALVPLLPPDLAPWLAPLIVGAVVLAIGLIALSSGRSKLDAGNLKPQRSMRSLRNDQRMVKEHLQ